MITPTSVKISMNARVSPAIRSSSLHILRTKTFQASISVLPYRIWGFRGGPEPAAKSVSIAYLARAFFTKSRQNLRASSPGRPFVFMSLTYASRTGLILSLIFASSSALALVNLWPFFIDHSRDSSSTSLHARACFSNHSSFSFSMICWMSFGSEFHFSLFMATKETVGAGAGVVFPGESRHVGKLPPLQGFDGIVDTIGEAPLHGVVSLRHGHGGGSGAGRGDNFRGIGVALEPDTLEVLHLGDEILGMPDKRAGPHEKEDLH